MLILLSRLEQRDYLASVEWETLLFFAGLFVMVGSLVKTGVIDNIPFTATMTPIVGELSASISDLSHPDVQWWVLALGADFGGNLTAVGASANVVILGIARRADHPISFWELTRKGLLITVVSIALSALYLWFTASSST